MTLEELTEARLLLETSVVRVATERATEEHFEYLEANVDIAESYLRQDRYEDKIDIHIGFHNLLAGATGNPIMVMLMAR